MPDILPTQFTPLASLAGGLLIGVSAALLLLISGRIAGISGIVAGLIEPRRDDWQWRAAFVIALIAGAALAAALNPPLVVSLTGHWGLLLVGGLVTGVGVRVGSGCTSGHGVCGIGRLAPRSMIATAVFMGTAALTVFLVRHLPGLVS